MRCLRATCYLNLFFVSLFSPHGGDGFLHPDIPVLVRNPFFGRAACGPVSDAVF